ncbi:LysM peptidoglycan-binding domain-containing protein [uncultured Arsenicicoccus sp.]|uniref:LysM peptidoglycan-binding domain-containing protein n=1 Tax=uncultured Arsenicicoccus sp. TaxID=491339 RepID=UPI0025947FF1|nr:LysM peptidoglycan-binding domain-containing protein [uncultured Arsenicicoccus sp.]
MTTATVTILKPAPGRDAVAAARTIDATLRQPTQTKAMLVTDTGLKFVIPFAPRETDLTGYAPRWDTISRPGRKPLVRYAGGDARTLSFSFLVETVTGASVEPTLSYLERLAAGPQRITVTGMSTRERGPWRLDKLSIKPGKRRPGDNAITSARVDIDLLEAIDVKVQALPANKGPVSGGVHKAPPAPVVKPKPTPRYHTVKRGDTLWHIARRYYGNPLRWPVIAKANRSKIRNPHWIYPGQRFVIPPLTK